MRRIGTHSVRTMRRRFRADRRGQVAAVATLFGLLIVVSLIAELALAPLPTAEQNAELQHLLLEENQFGQLQTDLLVEVASPSVHQVLTAPVTLGSSPIPPFGPAASSQLSLLPSGASTRVTAESVKPGPVSNTGGLCNGGLVTSGNRTTCTFTVNSCTSAETWNVTLSHQSYFFAIAGSSGACPYVNVTGDFNTITLNITDNNMVPAFNFTLYGSHDTVVVNWEGGSGSVLKFTLYGSNNTYRYGSKYNGKGSAVVTKFIGEPEPQVAPGCPYKNLASTDKVGPLPVSSSGNVQSLFFYNSLGINNGPHLVTPAGGPALTWQNISQAPSATQCAFGGTGPTGVFAPFLVGAGSLSAGLQNHYLGTETLSLEGGAVLVGQASGSTLIDPPSFNFTSNATANSAEFTLINFVESTSRTASGYSTAAIVTQLVSETSFQATFPISIGGGTVFVDPTLNVTTAYPAAWVSYFQSLAPTFLNGTIGCSSAASIASPATCLNPPIGQYVSLSIPLNIQFLEVTVAVIQISVE
ncbi:MAG: hypothetical protein L3J95_04900 [Thermoplasmata archaeon]|nr:hypothetical protein [Thermoplasmata archaeon]MCI4359740.1 hypothetical protein [Thermoplasmata archaeon]